MTGRIAWEENPISEQDMGRVEWKNHITTFCRKRPTFQPEIPHLHSYVKSLDNYPNFGFLFRYVFFKESHGPQEKSFSSNIFSISSSRREGISYSMRLDWVGAVNNNLEVFGAEMQNVSTDF
jgi:hypothetical protein